MFDKPCLLDILRVQASADVLSVHSCSRGCGWGGVGVLDSIATIATIAPANVTIKNLAYSRRLIDIREGSFLGKCKRVHCWMP